MKTKATMKCILWHYEQKYEKNKKYKLLASAPSRKFQADSSLFACRKIQCILNLVSSNCALFLGGGVC